MTDRNVVDISPDPNRKEARSPRRFSDFAERANLILLGDAGAGKTHLFEEVADASDGLCRKARGRHGQVPSPRVTARTRPQWKKPCPTGLCSRQWKSSSVTRESRSFDLIRSVLRSAISVLRLPNRPAPGSTLPRPSRCRGRPGRAKRASSVGAGARSDSKSNGAP
jgi:hypothetical protein